MYEKKIRDDAKYGRWKAPGSVVRLSADPA